MDECWRILKHKGIVVFHDFTYPTNNLIHVFWNGYFMILRITGVFLKSWKAVFQELDQVVKTSRWVEQTIDSLEQRGFEIFLAITIHWEQLSIIFAKKP